MKHLFVLMIVAGAATAQDAAPPKTPAVKKKSGLERQRASIERQIADTEQKGWFLLPPIPRETARQAKSDASLTPSSQ